MASSHSCQPQPQPGSLQAGPAAAPGAISWEIHAPRATAAEPQGHKYEYTSSTFQNHRHTSVFQMNSKLQTYNTAYRRSSSPEPEVRECMSRKGWERKVPALLLLVMTH